MPIRNLAHYWIRCHELNKSCHFYETVLGFIARCRPTSDAPGVWMYMSGYETGIPTVYIVERFPSNPQFPTPGFQPRTSVLKYLSDAGSFDHLAFGVAGLIEFRNVSQSEGITWRESTDLDRGVHQVFQDPSGVNISLLPISEIAAMGSIFFP